MRSELPESQLKLRVGNEKETLEIVSDSRGNERVVATIEDTRIRMAGLNSYTLERIAAELGPNPNISYARALVLERIQQRIADAEQQKVLWEQLEHPDPYQTMRPEVIDFTTYSAYARLLRSLVHSAADISEEKLTFLVHQKRPEVFAFLEKSLRTLGEYRRLISAEFRRLMEDGASKDTPALTSDFAVKRAKAMISKWGKREARKSGERARFNIFLQQLDMFETMERILDNESRKLEKGFVFPPIALFLFYDLWKKIAELLNEITPNENFAMQTQKCWERIEWIHSQQLALTLVPILKQYFSSRDPNTLVGFGEKTGDAFARILYDLRESGFEINAFPFDLQPRDPLALEFAEDNPIADLGNKPLEGDIYSLKEVLAAESVSAPKVMLCSNIFHKLDPKRQAGVIKAIYEVLSSDGVLCLVTPYHSDSDASSELEAVYCSLDTTSHTRSIRPCEEWIGFLQRAGFETIEEHDLGHQITLLDGFKHVCLIARKTKTRSKIDERASGFTTIKIPEPLVEV